MIYVLAFIVCGALVVLAGHALARYADALAGATRLGKLWVGSVVLAGATSLPELVTDVSAVRMRAPDLAVGDLFGSSLANMLILAVVDLAAPNRRVLQSAAVDHLLVAFLAISLNILAAALVLTRADEWVAPVGMGSLIVLAAYTAGTRAIYHHVVHREPPSAGPPEAQSAPPAPLGRALAGFALSAVVILVSAPLFAWSAKGIATLTGLGNTFVGTWLVGLATSLPELVASLAAVRMGSLDLAVGNLFGSNAFNMIILVPLDLAQPGSLFQAVEPSHALSGMLAVLLMSIGAAATVYRTKRSPGVLEPGSLLMLLAYCAGLWFLYSQSVAR